MKGRSDQKFRIVIDGEERLLEAINLGAFKRLVEKSGLTDRPMVLYTTDPLDDAVWLIHSVWSPERGRWKAVQAEEGWDIL